MSNISENMQEVLIYLHQSGPLPIEQINGNTMAALLARDAVDFLFDGRRSKYNVRVKLTEPGKSLLAYVLSSMPKAYADCLAERRKHIPKKRQRSISSKRS